MKPARETEIKLLAVRDDLEVRAIRKHAESHGVRLKRFRQAPQRDVYLDDFGLHLCRAGHGLRLRELGNKRRLELKTSGTEKAGLHQRDEIEIELEGATPQYARDLPRAIRDLVEPLVFDSQLRAVVALRNDRRRCKARIDDSRAEICIDNVQVESADGEILGGFSELEIEIEPGCGVEPWLEWSGRLATDLGLAPSTVNKLRRGLAIAQGELSSVPNFRVQGDLPIREAALRSLGRYFAEMQRQEQRVRTEGSESSVHKLRVACRRMRATFSIFAGCFESSEISDYPLAAKQTGGAFGAVRDLDVLGERLLRDTQGLPKPLRKSGRGLIDALDRERQRRHKKARRKLRRSERLAACAAMQRWLDLPRQLDEGPSVFKEAPALIWSAAEAMFHAGRAIRPDSPDQRLHELRILGKRLRYTTEAFAEVYGRDLDRFIERTVHMQEILGAFQDASIGVERLLELAEQHDGRPELLTLGAWISLEQGRGRRARADFELAWPEFDSDDLRTYLDAVLRRPA